MLVDNDGFYSPQMYLKYCGLQEVYCGLKVAVGLLPYQFNQDYIGEKLTYTKLQGVSAIRIEHDFRHAIIQLS